MNKVCKEKALLGGGGHAAIVCYPIPLEILPEVRSYWKKALDEAEDEFETQHKKVIPTDGKTGVRGFVPKGFVQDTVAGICELTVLDRAYTDKNQYRNATE